MMSIRIGLALSLVLAMLVANGASAAPVTFRARGPIDYKAESPDPSLPTDQQTLLLDAISIGMPWEILVTFEPTTPAQDPFGGASRWYEEAVIAARLTIGPFVYTQLGGDMTTNLGLPVGDPSLLKPNHVQFHWTGGWDVPLGAPNLNSGHGVTTLSWNDACIRWTTGCQRSPMWLRCRAFSLASSGTLSKDPGLMRT
jgi:hypothetical protein